MRQVRLGGYPAKQCARLIHNQYVPGLAAPAPPPPELLARFEAGVVFERRVVDEIRARYGDSERLVLLADCADRDENRRRTVAAMTAGADMIVGGSLPDVNGRTGLPDVLIRQRDGYLPVDIKNHRTLKPAKGSGIEVSALTAPDQRQTHPGYSNRGDRWRDDAMQLAHYTRMLQELGLHPAGGPNIAGIIGTSELTSLAGDELGITWYDLDEEQIITYSASGPDNRRKRSALQRYDHEFGFRLRVAQAALDGAELVRPYRITDCGTCEWFEYCAAVAGADDASFAIETGPLNVREWQYLYENCGDGSALSVAQLAAVDTAAHEAAFRIQSVGTQQPHARLAAVVKRAGMTCAGIDFVPHQDPPPPVPTAGIEVDFDIEWDLDARIYQWGLRIRDGQDDSTARYEPVVSFDPLDDAAEIVLAEEFAARIRALRDRADREAKSLLIFHWHTPETSRTRKFAAVKAALHGLTFDLCKWFTAAYFARTSSSLKSIAPLFGFHWDVDAPGGLTSQVMIDAAREGGAQADEARQWCLRYNECDVAAQAAIRDGLRRQRA